MICLDCTHADLRANPTYSKMGFAKCTHISKKEYGESTFMSMNFDRDCVDYEQASNKIIAARDVWNLKRVA